MKSLKSKQNINFLEIQNNVFNSYKEKRRNLVEILKAKGIVSTNVLKAIGAVPRERFVSPAYISRAYDDSALPIDSGQTISQPYTVAFMTSLLNISEGSKILEIGTGSGYQACILSVMGASVFTIERIKELFEKSRNIFRELGFKINSRYGDGTLGWREFAPYDGIIITAGAPQIPKILLNQLAVNCRMVVPIGNRNSQTMYCVERKGERDYKETRQDSFKFVPLIGKDGWTGDEE
ncbi:MAG: pcm [Ignavibacteria bacterium]|nr:pcm [Ignavibacteria bacterium]